jgi:hypothetical protein
VAVGAVFALPVIVFVPVIAGELPSVTDVAIVKVLMYELVGVNVSPANRVLTFASTPLARQTLVVEPTVNVDVTEPDVAVLIVPAFLSDKVSVAVIIESASVSDTTIALAANDLGVVCMYDSAALMLTAVGALLSALKRSENELNPNDANIPDNCSRSVIFVLRGVAIVLICLI